MDKREFNKRLKEIEKELDSQKTKLLNLSEFENNPELSTKLKQIAEECDKDKRLVNKIAENIRKGKLTEEDKKLLITILKDNPVSRILED